MCLVKCSIILKRRFKSYYNKVRIFVGTNFSSVYKFKIFISLLYDFFLYNCIGLARATRQYSIIYVLLVLDPVAR